MELNGNFFIRAEWFLRYFNLNLKRDTGKKNFRGVEAFDDRERENEKYQNYINPCEPFL